MILAKPTWAVFKNMLHATICNPLWAFLSLIAAPFRVWKPLLQSFFILFIILFVVGLGGRMVLRDFSGFGPGSILVIAWGGVALLIMAATAFRLIAAPLILHYGNMEGETHGWARFATDKETAALNHSSTYSLIGNGRRGETKKQRPSGETAIGYQ
jgi:type IV secretion system protein VirD4